MASLHASAEVTWMTRGRADGNVGGERDMLQEVCRSRWGAGTFIADGSAAERVRGALGVAKFVFVFQSLDSFCLTARLRMEMNLLTYRMACPSVMCRIDFRMYRKIELPISATLELMAASFGS